MSMFLFSVATNNNVLYIAKYNVKKIYRSRVARINASI